MFNKHFIIIDNSNNLIPQRNLLHLYHDIYGALKMFPKL